MPIYEYRCEHCGHEMDKMQKLADPPLTDCPACGQPTLKKLISAAGFRLKGSGWYETDFKKGNKKNLHDSGTAKDAGNKSGDKKQTPAKTTEPKTKPVTKPAPSSGT